VPNRQFKAHTFVLVDKNYYHQKVNRQFPVHDNLHCLDYLWFRGIQPTAAVIVLHHFHWV